jgi:KaiC/GvpD/RAD55 family RecA-like ATPase
VDVPIDIPGLEQFIPILPFGAVVFVKGGVDPAKTFFAFHLVETANISGRSVNIITSRSRIEVEELLQEYFPAATDVNVIDFLKEDLMETIPSGSLVVVDSFSFLLLENDISYACAKIMDFKLASRMTSSLFVLVIDDGMLDERTEAALMHYSDGLIKFMTVESSEGMKRFMRIPLWVDRTCFDDNIFYAFNDGRISLDLKYRVV